MSKRTAPGRGAFWVLAASTAALGGYTAALALIWLCGRPGAALERLQGGDGAFGPIRDYTPGCFDSRGERGNT